MDDWYTYIGNVASNDPFMLGKMIGGLVLWSVFNSFLAFVANFGKGSK